MKCGKRKHFAFSVGSYSEPIHITNIIIIFEIKIMQYKEEFKEKSVWIDRIKGFLVANEENKPTLFKFCPNIFVEITNLVENKPQKRVLSSRKKQQQ